MLVAFMLSSLALAQVQGQTVNPDHPLIVELPGSTANKSAEIAGMLILKDPNSNHSSYPTPWIRMPSAKAVFLKVKKPIYSEFQAAVDCKFDQIGKLYGCKLVGSEPSVPGYSKVMDFAISQVRVSPEFVKIHYSEQLSLLFSIRLKDKGGIRAPTRPCLPYFCFNN